MVAILRGLSVRDHVVTRERTRLWVVPRSRRVIRLRTTGEGQQKDRAAELNNAGEGRLGPCRYGRGSVRTVPYITGEGLLGPCRRIDGRGSAVGPCRYGRGSVRTVPYITGEGLLGPCRRIDGRGSAVGPCRYGRGSVRTVPYITGEGLLGPCRRRGRERVGCGTVP